MRHSMIIRVHKLTSYVSYLGKNGPENASIRMMECVMYVMYALI